MAERGHMTKENNSPVTITKCTFDPVGGDFHIATSNGKSWAFNLFAPDGFQVLGDLCLMAGLDVIHDTNELIGRTLK